MSLGIVSRSFHRGLPHKATTIDGAPVVQSVKSKILYVDANSGGGGDGLSWESAFSTMQAAFNALVGGEQIYFVGTLREQLVTPVQIFDVAVIGAGNRPRHADSTPSGGNLYANSWRAPASGAVSGQATVRVLQQGWSFENILFTMESATAAGVEIVRNAGSGNAERDGSHARIVGCRFAGAGIGVRFNNTNFSENPYNVEIAYNKFNDNTTAIQGTQCNSGSIHHNEFQGCTSVITLAAQNTMIYENIVGAFTAASSSGGIDLNGGGGKCFVTKNYLSGTYSIAGGYRVSNANDEWAGNWNTLSGGITVLDPA